MPRLILLVFVLWGGVCAQSDAAEQSLRTASYYLAPVAASGVSGNLQVTERLEGGSTFIVTLQGITAGQRYALALFGGDCGPDRVRVRDLKPVGSFPDDPYASLTDTALDFGELTDGDYFLYVYAGDTSDTPLAACGEVGVDANAGATPTAPAATASEPAATSSTPPVTTATASSASAIPPEQSPRAVSYALSPVAGSGVSGNLQVSEQLGGGTRLTVSLVGTEAGGDYAAVLYRGDCGPDREEVARLANVNAADGNPNSSVTESPLSFDAVTGGDHFLYVLSGAPGSRVLACGEVGLGANS